MEVEAKTKDLFTDTPTPDISVNNEDNEITVTFAEGVECKVCFGRIPQWRADLKSPYCSTECGAIARNTRRRKRNPDTLITHCLVCGEPISEKRQHYGAKYCPYPEKKCKIIALKNQEIERQLEAHTRLEQEALQFHLENPHVLQWLINEALSRKRDGYTRYSLYLLWDQYRWSGVKTTGKPYKLNNRYRPFYARLIMQTEPRLKGFFE